MSRPSIALISVAVSLVSGQDILFPGETDRPSRFPLCTPRPTTPLPSPPEIETRTQPPVVPPVSLPTIEAYNGCAQRCVQRCSTTSEYNPVCGTDGVGYSNPGRLNCAFNCGNPVQFVKYEQCNTYNNRG